MRPLELRLQAFGPFAASETVDFTAPANQGLFVVAGPTGGGKSSIFDAMTFALYGKFASDRPADVRSHHATGDVVTEVEMMFEVDGQRYRVTRRPAQDRPKRRGYGTTTTPAEAELSEWTGAAWQGVLTGATQVAARLTEIVGLDAEQFQRVVLLPQGKFAEFLLADTGKRQALLRQLFGTGLYERATVWLRDEVARLAAHVQGFDIEIEHQRRVAQSSVLQIAAHLGREAIDETVHDQQSLEALDRSLASAAPLVAARRAEHDRCETLRAAAAHDAATAADMAARFDRARQLEEQQQSLSAAGPEMQATAERVELARRVQPVVVALDAAATAAAQTDAAAGRVASTSRGIESAVVGLGEVFTDDPMTVLAGVNARKARAVVAAERLIELERRRNDHLVCTDEAERARRAARDAAGAFERLHDELVAIGERRVVIDKRAGKRTALAEEVAGLGAVVDQRHRLDRVAGELHEALRDEQLAQQQEHAIVARFAAGIAPRLAAELRPGEPCVVCGGVDHPAPATYADGVGLVDAREVEAARQSVDRLRATTARLTAELELVSAELGDHADRFLGLVEAELIEVQGRLREAERAARDLDALDRDIVALQRRHEAADDLVRSTALELAAAEARLASSDARLAEADAAAVGLDAARISDELAQLEWLEGVLPTWQDEIELHARVVTERSLREDALRAAVVAAGLATADEARPLAIDDAELRRLDESVTRWQRATTRTADALDQLRVLGVPAERPDAEGLHAHATTLDRSVAAGAEIVANLEAALREGMAALAAATETTQLAEPAREQLDVARRVMATCTGAIGPGGQRITLETWVLAAELDRVAVAATEHLRRLSHGRYELRRGAPVSAGNRRTGLDILLFDAHTGRERGPRTLSGGEQFQASLALALGLADVVSHGGSASGRLFEALFVDEGFGSLDPAALDDAIDALHHLQATGRMVGVITHVEALKHQLPIGIEVRHRPDGRGSQVVQGAPAR